MKVILALLLPVFLLYDLVLLLFLIAPAFIPLLLLLDFDKLNSVVVTNRILTFLLQ